MSPLYMLDTDTVSLALRDEGRVAQRIREHRPSDLCISSISLSELRYGAELRRSQRIHRAISAFVAGIEVFAFDRDAAEKFGMAASSLTRRGETIGTFDNLIAAHALSLGVTLVTGNSRHFKRIPDLKTENWK
jgi:tRNA(fMet)-specific endonuclease VapC